MWPIQGTNREGLDRYLVDMLDMDEEAVNDIGQVTIKRNYERRPKNRDEAIVTFDSAEIRDFVKSLAPALAGKQDAGMRLHIPDHLQKLFRSYMNLAYDLKKKHKNLKRNVKFEDETLSLYMDIQVAPEEEWKRIGKEQVQRAANSRTTSTNAPPLLEADAIEDLLKDTTDGSEQE